MPKLNNSITFTKNTLAKKVYLISGLGADKRAFMNLDLSEFELVHLNWIHPLKNESIESYAKRLAQKIKEPLPIIIGLSFGGMLAIEISKLMPVKKLILISTIKTRKEMPWLYKIAGQFKLNKIIPLRLMHNLNPITAKYIGIKTTAEKQLSKALLKETNTAFMHWAINVIVNWQNNITPNNYIQIHGSSDLIFPISNIKHQYTIKNGTHIMVINKAAEVSNIIKKEINNL